MRRPPLLRDRPPLLQGVLVGLVPLVYGIVCGLVLQSSSGIYGLLALLGLLGAFLSGLEHPTSAEAALRGAVVGLVFGLGVLLGQALGGGDVAPKPAPTVVFLLVAIVFTAGAVALGARVLPGRFRA